MRRMIWTATLAGLVCAMAFAEGAKPGTGKAAPPAADPKALVDRTALLKADAEHLTVYLRYHGPEEAGKPYYRLLLAGPAAEHGKSHGTELFATMDKETAGKLIGALAESEILARAQDITKPDWRPAAPAGPCYNIQISGGKKLYTLSLGWETPMAENLLRLRATLSGDSAKAMDTLLVRLSDLFLQWTGKPYEPPK